MAITTQAKTLLKLNVASAVKGTSQSAAFGADAKGGDYKLLFLFQNAGNAAATATISVGDGIQGAGADLTVSVKAAGASDGGDVQALVVDSGYFKNVSGEYKDYIKVTPSAALTVRIIELPQ